MNELYLAFYDAKTRQLHIDDCPVKDVSGIPYVTYRKPYVILKPHILVGRLDHKRTFGFLRQETGDIYIEGESLKDAMHDDIVLVSDGNDPKVIMVLRRALTHVITTVVRKGKRNVYEDHVSGHRINAPVPDELVPGHVVRLKVRTISRGVINGTIDKVIGHVNDPDIETMKIVYAYDWPTRFPDDVMDSLDDAITNARQDKTPRRDLTGLLTVTIDGADAKDLDDAISLEVKDGTYRLGVHIADVSHYVREGSALDEEAFRRATSVYLADRVIPMLPHLLSNDWCSLNPDTQKKTLSCLMTLDGNGHVIDHEIVPSVIRSDRRLTYAEVNAFLKERKPLGNKAIETMLSEMARLSSILQDVRKQRGEIAFESVELGFKVDRDGRVLDVYERTTDVAEELIESFMLAANETVARHMDEAGFPSIYRIHEKPDLEKLKDALSTVKRLGIPVSMKSLGSAVPIQKATEASAGSPLVTVVHMLLLRAMQKARYSPKRDIHFGLGATYYTHFTSPIRRYPDLMLHRLIRTFVFKEADDMATAKTHYADIMPEVATHTSDQERKAIDMERDVDKLKSAEYMSTKTGERFPAIITQMMPSGMFVRIEKGIEGFVALRTMDDYYKYDEAMIRYVGNRGKSYRLGDRVEVELKSVDMMTRKIDFIMIGHDSAKRKNTP